VNAGRIFCPHELRVALAARGRRRCVREPHRERDRVRPAGDRAPARDPRAGPRVRRDAQRRDLGPPGEAPRREGLPRRGAGPRPHGRALGPPLERRRPAPARGAGPPRRRSMARARGPTRPPPPARWRSSARPAGRRPRPTSSRPASASAARAAPVRSRSRAAPAPWPARGSTRPRERRPLHARAGREPGRLVARAGRRPNGRTQVVQPMPAPGAWDTALGERPPGAAVERVRERHERHG
jgi:hypothetical protein